MTYLMPFLLQDDGCAVPALEPSLSVAAGW